MLTRYCSSGKTGQIAGNKGDHDNVHHILFPVGNHGGHGADADADGRDRREATHGVCGDHLRPLLPFNIHYRRTGKCQGSDTLYQLFIAIGNVEEIIS